MADSCVHHTHRVSRPCSTAMASTPSGKGMIGGMDASGTGPGKMGMGIASMSPSSAMGAMKMGMMAVRA